MITASLTFLLCFFAVTAVVQKFCRSIRTKNYVLLAFSLLCSLWGGVSALLTLLAVSAVNWYGALSVDGQRHAGGRKSRMRLTVAMDVVILLAVRLYHILPGGREPDGILRYAVPMGVMFYTIQLITYVVDVYEGRVQAQKSYAKVLLYAGLFCQSAGGPVVRYEVLGSELESRKIKKGEVSRGFLRFSCGLAKKVILADSCGAVADALLSRSADTLTATPVLGVWLGGICFFLQVILELTAYADMAVGMGLILGFHLPENMNAPCVSLTLREFWQRFNITVVEFFKNYVYIPLGGSRGTGAAALMNLLIAWLCFGLWNGSYPNFLLWALYCVVLLLLERVFIRKLVNTRWLGHLWVLGTMCFGFLLMRYTDLGVLAMALKGLIGLNGAGFANAEVGLLLLHRLPMLVLSVAAVTPVGSLVGMVWNGLGKTSAKWYYSRQIWNAVCPALLLVLSGMAMVGNQVPMFLFL